MKTAGSDRKGTVCRGDAKKGMEGETPRPWATKEKGTGIICPVPFRHKQPKEGGK